MLHLFVTDKRKIFDFSRAIFFDNWLIGRVVVDDFIELVIVLRARIYAYSLMRRTNFGTTLPRHFRANAQCCFS